MGVVFTPEAVRAGEIPEIGSHSKASDFLLDTIFDGTESHDGVVAAMTYGSSTNGKANRRSDLDVLVVYDGALTDQALRRCREDFAQTTETFHVPIEPHLSPLHPDSAGREDHHLDYTFYTHFRDVAQRDAGRWARNEPLSHLEMPEFDVDAIITRTQQYIGSKAYRFAKASVAAELDSTDIQRGLELPSSIARHTLNVAQLVGMEFLADRGDRRGLSAKSRACLESVPIDTDEGIESHDALTAKDREYSDLLEATVAGNSSVQDYEDWLASAGRDIQLDAVKLTNVWQRVVNHLTQQG